MREDDRRYRIRRGLFGKAILQVWATPFLAEPHRWIDVKAKEAPEIIKAFRSK